MLQPRVKLVFPIAVCCALVLTAAPIGLCGASEPPPSAPPWAALAWGKTVGKVAGDEAISEGPMSFAISEQGEAWVLDQVNHRVLGMDRKGTPVRAIGLDKTSAFDDLIQVDSGHLVVLDRLKSEQLVVLTTDGKVVVQLPLIGKGIETPGLITELFHRPDGVWVEVESYYSVKLLNRELKPCERQVLQGRPISNHRRLQAYLNDQGGMVVSVGSRLQRLPDRSVSVYGTLPLQHILVCDMDAKGNVHAVVQETAYSPVPPYKVTQDRYLWIVLDETLHEVGRKSFPVFTSQFEQRVDFRLTPQGSLWQMGFTDKDVRIFSWGKVKP